jgi:hypothetical protein
MKLDGTKLKYAKTEGDLKSSTGCKSIELKAALIISEKDTQGRFWIRIKGKVNREIACKTKESRDKWIDLLKAASGDVKATEKPKEDPKKEKPKEDPKKTKEDPKKEKPKEDPKKAAPAKKEDKKPEEDDKTKKAEKKKSEDEEDEEEDDEEEDYEEEED